MPPEPNTRPDIVKKTRGEGATSPGLSHRGEVYPTVSSSGAVCQSATPDDQLAYYGAPMNDSFDYIVRT